MKVFLHLQVILITILIQGCAGQQLQTGNNAYAQGNYDEAAANWNSLAQNGNYLAQYNLGLLWERGLGSTPKDLSTAADWYIASARQGYVPAMIRLASIQSRSGYEKEAVSWYNEAARRGSQPARNALEDRSLPIPTITVQQEVADTTSTKDALEGFGILLEALYPSDTSSSSSSSYSRSAPSRSVNQSECSSDFNCKSGQLCVKAPMKSKGVCMTSVDEVGQKKYSNPSIDSTLPNVSTEGQCYFDPDCPPNFRCDKVYKVCVK